MTDFNIVDVFSAIAERVPERPSVVKGDAMLTFDALNARRRRLGGHLRSCGLGMVRPRTDRCHTGQDHIGILLYNGSEYIESILAVLGIRAVPFNINWRYTADELTKLLDAAGVRALIYHGQFAPIVAEVRSRLPALPALLQVQDGSGHELLDGADDYETVVRSGAVPLELSRSAEDRYLIFTGGTTGLPKGVVWRQADLFVSALGGRSRGAEFGALDEIVLRAEQSSNNVGLAPAPFMHGSAQWAALATLLAGGTVAIQSEPRRFDPSGVWQTISRAGVTTLSIVGEAFGGPLLDALSREPTPSSLGTLFTGGAALSNKTKEGFRAAFPGLRIIDLLGASESGTQAIGADGTESVPSFHLTRNAVLISDDRSQVLEPVYPAVGLLASAGRVPVAYLGDRVATDATFPEIDGVRYSVPGDHVRLQSDGSVEFVGRGSSVINTGGEKVYAEEVEAAVRGLPEVRDALVLGRPSERLGNEVVALVAFVDGARLDVDMVRSQLRGALASYKLPRALIEVDEVPRTVTGKPDLSGARRLLDIATSKVRS
jgi:3-oxocholest-4-en-26-oate---CoA ligase